MAKEENTVAQDLFLGRQSILDRDRNLYGFELLFRSSSQNNAVFEDGLPASAEVFNHVFTELGVDSVLGPYRGFINIPLSLLGSDLVEIIPNDKITLEIIGTESLTPDVIERCIELRRKGYKLALDEFVHGDSSHTAILPFMDMVKVDVTTLAPAQFELVTQALKLHKIPLIAERVETHEQAEHCLALGYTYLQGNYFMRPTVLEGKRLAHSEMAVIRLLGMLLADEDSEKIVDAMKRHPDLSLSLIKLVNTAAVGAKTRIESLNHAIIVLGRAALKRWVQVLLFVVAAAPGVKFPSPLLVLAAARGRLMELMAGKLLNQDKRSQEKAYLAGMLSLMPALFGLTLAEFLKHLPVDQEVNEALCNQSGKLGSLLALTELLDMPNFAYSQFSFQEIGKMEPSALLGLQMEAMTWANSLGDGI
ncbi:MAG: EAL and HDOD domain-containing protein [Burkholderiales bacterium]